jgi:ATP diphosphatase
VSVSIGILRRAWWRNWRRKRRKSWKRKKAGAPQAEIEEEIGDLLFVVANLARHLKVQPEDALRAANEKFSRRFRFIEQSLHAQGKSPAGATLDEMEALWQQAKRAE